MGWITQLVNLSFVFNYGNAGEGRVHTGIMYIQEFDETNATSQLSESVPGPALTDTNTWYSSFRIFATYVPCAFSMPYLEIWMAPGDDCVFTSYCSVPGMVEQRGQLRNAESHARWPHRV